MEEIWKQRLKDYISGVISETATFTEKEAQAIRGFMQELLMEENKNATALAKRLIGDALVKRNETSDEMVASQSSSDAKEFVRYFRALFYGRQDVFALRWENEKTGASGYTPKCVNEWRRGICTKGQCKNACRNCPHQEYQPLTDNMIEQHFKTFGKHAVVLGIYPMLEDETCYFLAIDFDEGNWKDAMKAVQEIGREVGIETYMERSRSGNGGHLWLFFSEAIKASLARAMGTKLLEVAVSRYDILDFTSFDRMFPNQDRMPSGGLGNLIALPLQRMAVEHQNGVFVDEQFITYRSQKNLLYGVKRYSKEAIMEALKQFPESALEDVDEREIAEETEHLPWAKKREETVPDNLPHRLEAVLYDRLYISQKDLHPFLRKKFRVLAVFRNPEYYQARAMRKNLSKIPMWIQCFEENKDYLLIPIGCEEAVREVCGRYHVQLDIDDKRVAGEDLEVEFHGDLRVKQLKAVEEILAYPNGILHANTAFGKTVAAIAVIAERKVNTLIIVDRVQLLEQWRERLSIFLNIPSKEIGNIGGGKSKITGKIDIALCQSLVRNEAAFDLVEKYGQIIVDECHHVSAAGFEEILKHAPARYKLGLTATLKRKDGRERIVLMQLGNVRYKDLAKVGGAGMHKVIVREMDTELPEQREEVTIHQVYEAIFRNQKRNETIVHDVKQALENGRYPLILTERKEHVEIFKEYFREMEHVYYLTGGIKRKELEKVMEALYNLPDTEPRLLVATSKFIGEGFDYPILDTLFLTMPVSWSGRIRQYAGRLHREYHAKKDVLIYDYVDCHLEKAEKMFTRRSKGYKSMGYEMEREGQS